MSKKSNSSRVIWAVLAVFFGALFVLQVGGIVMVTLMPSFSILTSNYLISINLTIVIILYLALIFTKRKYNRQNKSSAGLSLTRQNYIIIALLIIISLVPLLNMSSIEKRSENKNSNMSFEERWQIFNDESVQTASYTNLAQETTRTFGCFDDEGNLEKEDGFCRFENLEYYIAEGDYRQYLRNILTHMQNNGYTFPEYENQGTDRFTDEGINNSRQRGQLTISLENKDMQRNVLIRLVDKKAAEFYSYPEKLTSELSEAFDNNLEVFQIMIQTDQ